jgi:hypothetical protein
MNAAPLLCPSCSRSVTPDYRFCPRCGQPLPGPVAAAPAPVPPADAGAADALEAKLRQALSPGLLLVRRLGEGGMSSVFLAREPSLRRLVAVKVLAPQLASDPHARARFEREAQAVAGLVHPNVVAIHGVGTLDDGTPYFVMQYVGGRSMAARVESDGPLDVDEARRVIGEVASALAAAHAKGIIHRDIKPANILYDEDAGRVLVSDFGIAAVKDPTSAKGDTRLTQTGMVVGTPQYMSPEQLLSEEVTERTDVYALGLLAYELLAGAGPFKATTPQELIAMHLRDAPPRLSDRRKDVDPELEGLVAACLQKDPAKRPAAAEVARRLAPGAGIPLEWPPPGLDALHGALPRLGRRFWLGSLSLAVAMLGFVAMGTQLSWAAASLGNIVLSVAAVVGSVALVVAARGLLRAGREAVHALDLGYTWLTIAEVAADRRGDTGALVAGAREYAGLEAAIRDGLRRGRVASALLELAGAVLPVPLIVVTAWLGSAGVISSAAAPWLILGPSLLALAAASVVARRERRAVAAARGQLAKRRQRASNVPRLVEPWYESYDSVTRAHALGRGGGGHRRLGWGAAVAWAALTIAVVIALVPLWLAGALGPSRWTGARGNIQNTLDKLRIANVARDFAPPTDPAITPRQAGEAFWALQGRGAPRPGPSSTLLLLPARRLPELPHLDLPGDPRFAKRMHTAWMGPALLAGVPGKWGYATIGPLTPAERSYLAELAGSPAWREFETVARARAVDYLGTRYALPFPDTASWLDMGIPRFAALKELAYGNGPRAAYFLAQGRPADAERALRDGLAFGYRLLDDGNTLIEALIGVVIAGISRSQLIEFYTMTGRPEAQVLRARRDSAIALVENAAASPRAGNFDVVTARTTITAIALDPTMPRSLRYEMLAGLGMAPCTNVRELIFGAGAGVDTTFARARRQLARYPGDSALINLMQQAPERGVRLDTQRGLLARAAIGASRLAGRLLGNRRFGGCAELLLGMAAP